MKLKHKCFIDVSLKPKYRTSNSTLAENWDTLSEVRKLRYQKRSVMDLLCERERDTECNMRHMRKSAACAVLWNLSVVVHNWNELALYLSEDSNWRAGYFTIIFYYKKEGDVFLPGTKLLCERWEVSCEQ